MKKIYIVGYRGTRVAKYIDMIEGGELHPLLYAGHVGIQIGDVIYGFRLSDEAAENFIKEGVDVLKYLKANNTIEGRLYDDTKFLIVAAEIAADAGTHVYQLEMK